MGAACSDGTAAFEVLAFMLRVVCFYEVVCSCLAASWSLSVIDVSVTVGCVFSYSRWSNNNHPPSSCGLSEVDLVAQF